jgi:integrase
MYLLVTPRGRKWWRFDYRFNGKRCTLSFGVYDDVSLKTARERRREARELVANGINPSEVRKKEKVARAQARTFEEITEEWRGKKALAWTPGHTERVHSRLKAYVYPWLGNKAIDGITAPVLLEVLRRVEDKGAYETARKLRGYCGQVFRYAIACGFATRDVSQDLRGALAPKTTNHLASITDPKAIGGLLRAIDDYKGYIVTRCALRLSALTFARPGEIRRAEWVEIDWDAAEWRIPAEKMKKPRPHVVPLSRQALDVLQELQPLTGSARFLFPGVRKRTRPMSDATITNALRNMGYSGDEMTAHGFRSMASTRLNELGWNRDAIERQLAHVEGNAVRAAYNYAEHLDERRRMMQAWADYLDVLRSSVDVMLIPGKEKFA